MVRKIIDQMENYNEYSLYKWTQKQQFLIQRIYILYIHKLYFILLAKFFFLKFEFNWLTILILVYLSINFGLDNKIYLHHISFNISSSKNYFRIKTKIWNEKRKNS